MLLFSTLNPLQNAEKLDSNIIYDRDFDYDYFGFKVKLCAAVRGACAGVPVVSVTRRLRAVGHCHGFCMQVVGGSADRPYSCPLQTLERSYLLKVNGVVVERPQHMLMRVSVNI